MAITLTEANRYNLLEVQTLLEASQPFVLRLTNAEGGLTVDTFDYDPEPTLEFQLPEYSGAIEIGQVAAFRMADKYQYWRDLLSGRAAPRVLVRMREVAFDPETLLTTSLVTFWIGELESGEINPEGKPGVVELRATRCGGRIDKELGPEVSDLCWKTFGNFKNCGVNVEALKIVTEIDAIDRTRITITDPAVTGQVNSYWQMGSVTRGDVRINIRKWTSGSTFILSEYPPQEWVDSLATAPPLTATVRPGCRKTLADCRRYLNEPNFGGIGLRVPSRNVLFELE